MARLVEGLKWANSVNHQENAQKSGEVATLWNTIFVSGGKRGLDIKRGPHDLVQILSATVADISGSSVFNRVRAYTLTGKTEVVLSRQRRLRTDAIRN